jgi:hypothetical protein
MRRIHTTEKSDTPFAVIVSTYDLIYPAEAVPDQQFAMALVYPAGSPPISHPAPCVEFVVDSASKNWARFQSLVEQWRRERGALSSITEMSMLPSYQALIGMGEAAVPLILAQLRSEGDEPDQWFWALKAITGISPVQPEDQGDFVRMARAWLRWGEEQGYAG